MANKMLDDLDFLEIPTNISALDPITYQYFNQLLNYRTIIMNTGVDDNLLESVIIPLKNFEKDDNNEPITLILQSVGGSVIDGMVLMNIIDGSMELKINSTVGSMNEDIDIEKNGRDLMIGFNPKFLIDALRVIDDEEISMYLVNPKAPCFIRDDENNYIYLILPVNFTTVS